MLDRVKFFIAVRTSVFGGKITKLQVAGIEMVLDEADRRRTPLNDLSYYLATDWWETGKTMQPVREAFYIGSFAKAEAWRKKNLRYYPYYGRGLVQLTWDYNYKKASKLYGVDLVKEPDLALDPALSVRIMFDGMDEGWFTGKKLDDFIDDLEESDKEDFREYEAARQIVNGKDKAGTIAAAAVKFEKALRAAGYSTAYVAPPVEPEPAPEEPGMTDDELIARAREIVVDGAFIEKWTLAAGVSTHMPPAEIIAVLAALVALREQQLAALMSEAAGEG